MSNKPTGLSGFMQPTIRTEQPESPKQAKADARTALTVRLDPDSYERIGHFLVSNKKEFLSFQALAIEGINRIFKERGLKPLK